LDSFQQNLLADVLPVPVEKHPVIMESERTAELFFAWMKQTGAGALPVMQMTSGL
jgi:hypothetical protein